jgi:hypothetical protein
MNAIEIIEEIPSEEVALPRPLRSAVEEELVLVCDLPAFLLPIEEVGDLEDLGKIFRLESVSELDDPAIGRGELVGDDEADEIIFESEAGELRFEEG